MNKYIKPFLNNKYKKTKNHKTSICAIIMAAGLSKRMGKRNKLLMELDGIPILEHVLRAVTGYKEFEKVIVVASCREVISLAKNYDVTVINNEKPNDGVGHTIAISVTEADKRAYYMFFAGDQPFISTLLIESLVKRIMPNKIIVPVYRGNHGLPSIFPQILREELLALQGDEGGRQIKKKHPEMIEIIEFVESEYFLDIDDLKDYEKLKEL